MQISEELLDYIDNLWIVDTHEHIQMNEEDRPAEADVLQEYLQHYINCDLLSAGLSAKDCARATDPALDIEQRFALLAPYWGYVRHGGYAKSLELSVQGLYGIPAISQSTIGELQNRFQRAWNGNHYQYVLKEKSRIAMSIVNSNLNCDRRFFRSVFSLDSFVHIKTRRDIQTEEEIFGKRISCLDDWLDACELKMERSLAQGAVALKSGLAYTRSLLFERSALPDAKAVFDRYFDTKFFPRSQEAPFYSDKKLEDYVMHHILNLANKKGLVVEIHTGLQEGVGNYISNSDPVLLTNLFLQYPDIRFDIFHMGYPFEKTLGVLAKNFRNVFINLCWVHMISPMAGINAMREYLDIVPINKISAFGGDYLFVDGVYGHQRMARDNVCRALSIKMEEGAFGLAEAKEIARLWFVENPKTLYGLHDL